VASLSLIRPCDFALMMKFRNHMLKNFWLKNNKVKFSPPPTLSPNINYSDEHYIKLLFKCTCKWFVSYQHNVQQRLIWYRLPPEIFHNGSLSLLGNRWNVGWNLIHSHFGPIHHRSAYFVTFPFFVAACRTGSIAILKIWANTNSTESCEVDNHNPQIHGKYTK